MGDFLYILLYTLYTFLSQFRCIHRSWKFVKGENKNLFWRCQNRFFRTLVPDFRDLKTGFCWSENRLYYRQKPFFSDPKTGFSDLKTCFPDLKAGVGNHKTGFCWSKKPVLAILKLDFASSKPVFAISKIVLAILAKNNTGYHWLQGNYL